MGVLHWVWGVTELIWVVSSVSNVDVSEWFQFKDENPSPNFVISPSSLKAMQSTSSTLTTQSTPPAPPPPGRLTLKPLSSPTSGFLFPSIYSFPPFFTKQPNPQTWSHQLSQWIQLILAYCKFTKTSEFNAISNQLVNDSELFNNKAIKREYSLYTYLYLNREETDQGSERVSRSITSRSFIWNFNLNVKLESTDDRIPLSHILTLNNVVVETSHYQRGLLHLLENSSGMVENYLRLGAYLSPLSSTSCPKRRGLIVEKWWVFAD